MVLAAVFVLAVAQGPIVLKYMPPIGKAFRYRFTMEMNQEIPNVGPMNLTSAMDMSLKALARSGNVTTLETRTSNAKVTVPANSPMVGMKAAMEKQMNGIVLQSRIDSRFKPLGVVSKGPNGQKAAAMGSQLTGSLSGMSFPDRPVRVGETWSVSYDTGKLLGQSMGAGMKASGTIPVKLKLVSVKGGVARVSLTMSGKTNMTAQGRQMTMTTVGSGWSDFELGTGVLRGMRLESTNKINFGSMTMNQKIMQSMKRL